MIVGDDEAVLINDETRTKASFLKVFLGLLAKKLFKKIVETLIIAKGILIKVAINPATALNGFLCSYIDDRRADHLRKGAETLRDHDNIAGFGLCAKHSQKENQSNQNSPQEKVGKMTPTKTTVLTKHNRLHHHK